MLFQVALVAAPDLADMQLVLPAGGFFYADQSERSIIIQTVINITLIGVGYWLGASKSGTVRDKIEVKPTEEEKP